MSNPFDFFDPTGSRQADFMRGFQEAVAARAARGKPTVVPIPEARVCSTQRELADWFMAFAAACGSNVPAVTP